MKKAFIVFIICLLALAKLHTQVIEKFSFDMDEMVYPRGFLTNGVAIILLTKVKLLPFINNVAG